MGLQVSPRVRHNTRVLGEGEPVIVLAHGYGCDQFVWKDVAPPLAAHARVVLFDHAGSGGAAPDLYDRRRHSTLAGYAQDVVRLLDDLALGPVDFVGHSVSAMIGAIAATDRPDLFGTIVMMGPSACYLNEDGYHGGFDRADVDELLALLDENFVGFANTFAPIAIGNHERPELASEFAATLCRNDPEIASAFARVTFLTDCRDLLGRVGTPVAVLACRDDPIAPEDAIRCVHERLRGSTLHILDATGHCPHITHPGVIVAALRERLLADPARPALAGH